jgi:hypothetical protein
MSIHTLTVDQLMQLDKYTLQYALRVFQKELDGTLDLLRDTPESRGDEVLLGDLNSLLTLRKAIALRLEELTVEEAPESKLSRGSTPLANAA